MDRLWVPGRGRQERAPPAALLPPDISWIFRRGNSCPALDGAVGHHGVRHLDEARDIGPLDVVAIPSAPVAVPSPDSIAVSVPVSVFGFKKRKACQLFLFRNAVDFWNTVDRRFDSHRSFGGHSLHGGLASHRLQAYDEVESEDKAPDEAEAPLEPAPAQAGLEGIDLFGVRSRDPRSQGDRGVEGSGLPAARVLPDGVCVLSTPIGEADGPRW